MVKSHKEFLLQVVVVELEGSESEALDLVPLVTNCGKGNKIVLILFSQTLRYNAHAS